jgi:hypothetical protein
LHNAFLRLHDLFSASSAARLLPALGRWVMAVKIDTLETVPLHVFATQKPRKAGRLAATRVSRSARNGLGSPTTAFAAKADSIPPTFLACYDV